MEQRKVNYYKKVVKTYLNDIKEKIALSKNEMERSYYQGRYNVQLDQFAKALGVQAKYLKMFV